MRSGALITARLAADAGREVFAVPGSIHNPMARGCHRLLRDGAQLVESAEEVIAALEPIADALRRRLARPPARPQLIGDRCTAAQFTAHGCRTPSACGTRSATTQPLWKRLSREPD